MRTRAATAEYVLGLDVVDRTMVTAVGGKGAQLGELSRMADVSVPAGFCVTIDAFERAMAEAPSLEHWLDRLADVNAADRTSMSALSASVRAVVEAVAVPNDVVGAIAGALARLGPLAAYAVRSSATAEDLPTASFAGQHDTYLNVVGAAAVVEHVRRCWASLFTERAVAYRLRNGIDHREVRMAVVVQHLPVPEAAGVMFTADPVTSHRKVASVEATFGLGEALVSGRVNADVFKVRDGQVVARSVATKPLRVVASPEGGTDEAVIEPALRDRAALTDDQVVRLVQLGRRIEAHFGRPQDIEWCLVDDGFQIVQSRPMTTLFPIPAVADDEGHIYLSVGHQQMMTDPMKPLGLSVWQSTALRPMYEAGGRLFVDVTQQLASPSSRAGLMEMLGRSDPLLRDALQSVLDRGDVVPLLREGPIGGPPVGGAPTPIETDPRIVVELIEHNQASVAALRREIGAKSGSALLDFIDADLRELQRILADPLSHQAVMAGIEATWWLNEHLETWLGEKNAADPLTRSVPHNVTSEMGLALLDVADAIRPYPELVSFLRNVTDDGFVEQLSTLPGGRQAGDAIRAYLGRYGMRGIGEIDITRPRWSERPSMLIPVILAHVRKFEPGEAVRRFEQGRQEASEHAAAVLDRLRALPDGGQKAEATKRMIDRVRTFIGYREYPKYGMISRYFVYKQALLEEAGRLVRAGVLHEPEDIFFLTLPELHETVRTKSVSRELIDDRRQAFRSYHALTPPRALTSDGEVAVTAGYRRDDVPAGALPGVAASGGTVEGRARVIVDMAQAALERGDILVTTHTDPSWSPVFVAIDALVTEVGGVMTHGSVIAREYGLPAVVGVEQATTLIRDGQRIRVHGADGYVEILPS